MARFNHLRFRAILRTLKFRAHMTRLVWMKMHPIAGADGADDAAADGDDAGKTADDAKSGDDAAKVDKKAGDAGASGDDSGDDDAAAGKTADDPDWKTNSRKHEREAKKARKERDDLATKLKEREDADKSEQEKAIEKARDEGRTEALKSAEKDRRHDRLDIAATKTAVKGVKTGDDEDGKAVIAKFADPDDALIYIERAIKNGDIDEDDLFDSDGKVQADALASALAEVLESKPHLAAKTEEKPAVKKLTGSADAGKGEGGAKGIEDLSVEDHVNRLARK